MFVSPIIVRRLLCSAVLCGVGWALAGCDAPVATFRENKVYLHKQELQQQAKLEEKHRRDIADVLESLFGTPDQPLVPPLPDVDVSQVVDAQKLAMSAGRVLSTKGGNPQGLFREHCVHCHGISGDGAGPTSAYLNPYPRDYRPGIFKFKSTPKGMKPTHEDLLRVLVDGIPGTAMPSFKVLDEDEVESLVHYVKYLAIRGEVERKLVEAVGELEKEDRLFDVALKDKNAEKHQQQVAAIREVSTGVVQKWIDADSQATSIEKRPDGWQAPEAMAKSVARGRELFYGPIANCVKCHGDSALGDGQASDFDDWAKELEPSKPEIMEEFLALDSHILRPRNIRPRNLRMGIYRGGRRPIDLYWRIHNGIDGSPMPAAPLRQEGELADALKLTKDDIWCLVDYVRSLPNESISNPHEHQPQMPLARP